ncbi:CDP-alcohol phosphatidyltransferase family protein [Zhihengliuella salsuginis]|uniref:CDP-diacylglycerol--glycerol-3-phosphate 3-phosphatidyltransferase n=1 Tax=Zhihengliuella salsuginis TaxID=578222 RepID=A0ABQ3GHV8_9MICC|nr:CDP-alcohol phosphatidyltransferase family protein [Zhihengliuella salsuginis]GHD07754.1 CDP-diacylglycerol--glycerol-3-phosphate 3-phosphatidyltransferase [Zhihengliuella salsuginis]
MRLIGAGARDDIEYRVLTTFWTVPNVITVLRFCMVPFFVWLVFQSEFAWATAILAVLGSTDWIDGFIARRFNQMSTVGAWLDPLADRISLFVVAFTFVLAGIAPAWLVYAIVVPDVVLFVTSLILFRGSPELPVSVIGKIRTAILLVGAPLLLLGQVESIGNTVYDGVATIVLALGCVLHIIAAAGYFIAAVRKRRRERGADGSAPAGGSWSG